MKNALRVSAVLLSLCFLAGCVEVDSSKIYFRVEPDLHGKIKLQFLGIHAATADMKDFYQTYQETASEMISDWRIKDAVTKLDNKAETRCDGSIEGTFDDLLVSLGPILDGAQYEIKKDANAFSMRLTPQTGGDDRITFVLQYSGKVISSNAQRKDPQTGALEWDFTKLDASGVQFVLALK